jgi:D-tyrosyl-tRNA(Tyr) deacylase
MGRPVVSIGGIRVMRAVVQRVSRASVRVDGEVVGEIDRPGLLALVAATHDDTPERAARLARKIAELRILRQPGGPDAGADECSAVEIHAPVLVVSQFTLYADTRKGRRPSWGAAAPGSVAEPLVAAVAAGLQERGLEVALGRFGADMAVDLVNDGPVTLILEV